MKKLFLPFILLLISQFAFTQIYADSVLLDDKNAGKYLMVGPNYKKKQYYFSLQYADKKDKAKLTDAKGELLLFDSLVAGFDFLYQQGWEFCTAIDDVSGLNGIVSTTSIYVFQRRK